MINLLSIKKIQFFFAQNKSRIISGTLFGFSFAITALIFLTQFVYNNITPELSAFVLFQYISVFLITFFLQMTIAFILFDKDYVPSKYK